MTEKMLESQRNMMAQLTQVLTGGVDKGKGLMANPGEDSEEPMYPLGFTPPNVQTQAEMHPRRPSVTIGPQQFQAGASMPMNFQAGSGSNPGDNPTNPVIPDFDEVTEKEKVKAELPKQLEDRCKWLEEKFKAIENVDYYCGVNAKDLSLVPDLVLQPKFKTPEFEKYNGTSCPEAHITMFYRRMTGYVNNNQLLIHCFQDSLIGSVAKWYN
ncbi:uncharacterized protein LOC128036145 [Gossypium raimondii]|uniref:uncharacterized protein LOC128036145 n=1 Tax=Gossypium raimondii TaxID=29730 RepID=UPI00227CC408|nr:uncharacterized protein LOC128036145 [Gossypium raimondii]